MRHLLPIHNLLVIKDGVASFWSPSTLSMIHECSLNARDPVNFVCTSDMVLGKGSTFRYKVRLAELPEVRVSFFFSVQSSKQLGWPEM